MKKYNKNVKFKNEFAPILVNESAIKLGRKPVISIYAEIRR